MTTYSNVNITKNNFVSAFSATMEICSISRYIGNSEKMKRLFMDNIGQG